MEWMSLGGRRCPGMAAAAAWIGGLLVAGVVDTGTGMTALGQDRSQGRSMVLSTGGIVATEHPAASQAGAQILASGGNAIDAAVAANAAMGVLSPMMCGIGGDLFAIVYDADTGEVHGLNASGWSPAALTKERLRADGFDAVPIEHVHAVTVPGCVEGWHQLLHRFGTGTFAEALAPAIRMAEEGFPVTEWVAGYWAGSVGKLRRDPGAAAVFLPGGRAPGVGELFRNPDLAWSYRQLAADGRNAFYSGAVGKRMLDDAVRRSGTLRAEDLAGFEAEWVDTISTEYRGWTVHEIPPNGQGIAALMMLNIAENYPLTRYGFGSADALHVLIEAKKLAYADMLRHVGDLRFGSIPVEALLSKRYAAERARVIDMSRANGEPVPGLSTGPDTTYLCVVDAAGNMVSLIQSIYYGFGSGLVADGTGFALQNRGALFTLESGHPNELAPRKRPLHTIIPGFMSRGPRRIAFGIMGGWNQSQAHAQFVSNIVDHEMNLQAAMEAARFSKRTFGGCDVAMERRIPSAVRDALTARGHQIELKGDFSQTMGGGQAVMRDFDSRVNYGASDPRKDGAAVSEPF